MWLCNNYSTYSNTRTWDLLLHLKQNNMNFYIPEIGDHILLTSDWTFKLYAERRNEAVGELKGYYRQYGGWIKSTDLPKFVGPKYIIEYPDEKDFKDFFGRVDYKTWNVARQKSIDENIDYQNYLKGLTKHQDRAEKIGVDFIDITLPKGTILAIDRIYIRKGGSDFSSISFFIKNLPKVKGEKTKRPRFWAKLDECNTIQFEKTDKIK